MNTFFLITLTPHLKGQFKDLATKLYDDSSVGSVANFKAYDIPESLVYNFAMIKRPEHNNYGFWYLPLVGDDRDPKLFVSELDERSTDEFQEVMRNIREKSREIDIPHLVYGSPKD